jgi:hypothetical protein
LPNAARRAFQNTVSKDFPGLHSDPYTSAGFSAKEGAYANPNTFEQLIFYDATITIDALPARAGRAGSAKGS